MKNDFFKQVDPFVYDEMFTWNVYQANKEEYTNANVLDVGGHYGLFTYLAHTLGAKRIIAVEANPFNYLNYIKNTRDIPGVTAVNAAVSTDYGKLVTISNNSEKSTIGEGDINIATIRLSDAVELFPENEDIILKMDIEGAEYDALYNTPLNVLRKFKSIAIEIHQFPGSNNKFEHLETFLQNVGFSIAHKGTFYTDMPDGTRVGNDIIAVYKFVRI
jgi:FkbM family methyltransferase